MRNETVFADVDGDRRADYLRVDRGSEVVSEWLNDGGPDDEPDAAKVGGIQRGLLLRGRGLRVKGWCLETLTGKVGRSI